MTSLFALTQEGDDDSHQWQKTLYKKIGSRKSDEQTEPSAQDLQCSVQRVLAMAKVLHGLHLVSTRCDVSCSVHAVTSAAQYTR